MTGPFLVDTPRRVHRFWWTCLPALPTTPNSSAYRMLRRVWHDHTLNTFKQLNDGSWRPNARGFYTEGTEDQVTPALFETFSMLPENVWLPALLDRVGIAVAGALKRTRWCYAFEEAYQGRKFCIADVVLAWEDEAGPAVLVLEAKRRGVALSPKDLPGVAPYLRMPSLRAIDRRHYRLLVDEKDRPAIEALVPDGQPVLTWQALAAVQLSAAQSLAAAAETRNRMAATIEWNFIRCGVLPASAGVSEELAKCRGTVAEYTRIRAEGLPENVTTFLVGSTCCAAATRGLMPEPPYNYLRTEPAALDIYLAGKRHDPGHQSTPERRVAHWRLR